MKQSLNPVQVAVDMLNRVQDEEKGPYKVVYDKLKDLDRDHPKVAENHFNHDFGPEPMDYAIANLLFSAHAAFMYPEPPTQTRKDCLEAVHLIHTVPSGRVLLMSYIHEQYPQAVFCVEHLYFLNRQMQRYFGLSDDLRPEVLRGAKAEDWVYNQETIDKLRVLAIDTWKELEDARHADEAQPKG